MHESGPRRPTSYYLNMRVPVGKSWRLAVPTFWQRDGSVGEVSFHVFLRTLVLLAPILSASSSSCQDPIWHDRREPALIGRHGQGCAE